MYELFQEQSAVDGHQLPRRWRTMPITHKHVVVNFLNASRPSNEFPYHWKLLTPNERDQVLRHLAKLGLLSEFAKTRQDLLLMHNMQRAAESRPQWQNHEPPNGGKRILPSGYTVLREYWHTGADERLLPQRMNSGHIENALNLLKESNGNCVGKATQLLGVMRKHFRNSEAVCALLDKLCIEMQQVEVDEQYPIFQVLAATLAAREQLAKTRKIIEEAAGEDDDPHSPENYLDIPF